MATRWDEWEDLSADRRAELMAQVRADAAARLRSAALDSMPPAPLPAALLSWAPDWCATAALVVDTDLGVSTVDTARLEAAVHAVREAHPILRTRLAAHANGWQLQVQYPAASGSEVRPADGVMLTVQAAAESARMAVSPLVADPRSAALLADELRLAYHNTTGSATDRDYLEVAARRRLSTPARPSPDPDPTPEPRPTRLAAGTAGAARRRVTVPVDGDSLLCDARDVADPAPLLTALAAALLHRGIAETGEIVVGAVADTRTGAEATVLGPLSNLSLVHVRLTAGMRLAAALDATRQALGTATPVRPEDTAPPIVVSALRTDDGSVRWAEPAPFALWLQTLCGKESASLIADIDGAGVAEEEARSVLTGAADLLTRWRREPDRTIAELAAGIDGAAPARDPAAVLTELLRRNGITDITTAADALVPQPSTGAPAIEDVAADALALLDAAGLERDDVLGVSLPAHSHGDLIAALAARAVGAEVVAPDTPGVTVLPLDGPVSDAVVDRALRDGRRVVVGYTAPSARGWFAGLTADGDGRAVRTGGTAAYLDAGGLLLLCGNDGPVPTGWTVRAGRDGLFEPVEFDGATVTVDGQPVDVAAATEAARKAVPDQDAALVLPLLAAHLPSAPDPGDGLLLLLDATMAAATLDPVRDLCAAWTTDGVPTRPVWLAPEQLSAFTGDTRRAALTRLREEYEFDRAASRPPETVLEVKLVSEVINAQLGWSTVGRDENLFILGIDSFELIELLIAVEARFGTRVDVVTLFEEPTVARLADLLTAAPGETALTQLDSSW